MRCPRCGSDQSAVIDSRGEGSTIRRRRECETCHYRFTTFERIELALPMVVKKDGRREAYDRLKLKAGLLRACEKTPVSVDQIDTALDALETQLLDLSVKELPSRQIGDIVMETLKGLNKIAYVRFASVYREFSDISQFVDTLRSLNERKSESVRRSGTRRRRKLS